MKNSRINEASQCVTCGVRLRNAVFCPVCGRSSCSWKCSTRHLAQHANRSPGWLAGHAVDRRRDERSDVASDQMAAG